MSKRIINYVLSNGRAHDENGDAVKVEFVVEHEGVKIFGPYITVDGVLCKATDLDLWTDILSFWATPMSLDECLGDMLQREINHQREVKRLLKQTQ